MVRHFQDVGREACARARRSLSAAASMSPVQKDFPRAEAKEENEGPVALGRADVRLRPGVKDLEGDAGRNEPVSRLENLDRDVATRRRFQGFVEKEVSRRSPRNVDAIHRQELQCGEEPSGVVGVGMREDDGVERDGPQRREAQQQAGPAEIIGGVEGAAAIHEDATAVGHDQEGVPLADVQGDQPCFALPLGGGRARRREKDECESSGQGGAARPAQPECPGRREEEREESRLDEEGRRDDADGAERVEETKEGDDRLGKEP